MQSADGVLYEGKASRLKIFEFSKATSPVTRHRRIQEFQSSQGAGGGAAKVFIVTHSVSRLRLFVSR